MTKSPPVLATIIEAMRDPAAYPHPASAIEVLQTHISCVVLAGDHAYKLKKPLDLGFLDYTTLEKRRAMCEQEVLLNRRFCDGVYLGVVPITAQDGRLVVGGDGEAVEYAVHMRRVPAERMLDRLLAATEASHYVREVARTVAAFHARAPYSDDIASFGSIEAIRANWRENFNQLRPHAGPLFSIETLADIEAWVERFLEANASLLAGRQSAGRIRDCHGDLRADSVFVREDGRICIMDCIEFNDRIRYGDVAGDIGFLAMDLEHRGRRDLADELMGAYLDAAGDETLPLVLGMYKPYRALVRAKVEAMRSAEPDVQPQSRQASRAAAGEYLALAATYLEPAPRCLVYMVGLSGSGKSFLASALACRIGAVVLSTDAVRRELELTGERYGPAQRARVYEQLRSISAAYLREGHSVILDATHNAASDRRAARDLAEAAGVPALAVEVVADESLVRERLYARAQEGRSLSEATWEVYLAQKRTFEPMSDAEGAVLRVEGAAGVHAVDDVLAALIR